METNLTGILTKKFCLHNKCIVLETTDKSMRIGMCLPSEKIKEKIIHFAANRRALQSKKIYFESISEEKWNKEIAHLFSKEVLFVGREKKVDTSEANEAPIVHLLNSLLIEALEKKASDIHIEFETEIVNIRFRVVGLLEQHVELAHDIAHKLIQRIMLLSKLELSEKRRCQEGRFDYEYDAQYIDIRVSSVPSFFGQSVVLRLLNTDSRVFPLEKLGFTEIQRAQIKKMQGEKNGLILICGATGSGKTTTLSSIIQSLEKKSKKIISIEDPIEYIIPNIVQIAVNTELGLDYPVLLRRVVRQDPDILVIGEIRDEETAQIACHSAMTGHLVFATFHTLSALEAVYRLLEMGVKHYVLSSVLRWIIVQELKIIKKKDRQLQADITKVNEKMQKTIAKGNDFSEIADSFSTALRKEAFE
ncbi:MAG: GspE/PulE family protein [Spirochaetota bacterium]|jgi:type II secretory ATPase GspE/PulE/Tfp pilus assembly ATPase PilB-like protein|nr:GspE/PulE family protein [Spirochaetota bacterium]